MELATFASPSSEGASANGGLDQKTRNCIIGAMLLSTKTLPASGPLESLSEADRELLSSFGTFETATPGKILIHQGKPHGVLIFTISGLFYAKRLKGGKTDVLGSIQPGEWIGEINLFNPSSAVCSVEAVETSDYWIITRDSFESFINKHHAAGSILLISLAMTLGKRVRELTEKRTSAAKPKANTVLLTGLAAIATAAIVAGVSWGVSESHIAELRKESKTLIEQAEELLNESQLKVKTLELEVNRLQGELDWAMGDAERIKSQPSPVPTAQPSATTPVNPTATQDASTAPKSSRDQNKVSGQTPDTPEGNKEMHGSLEYPPEIILTKETTVPLSVGGRISGSATIVPGKTFKVVGVAGDDVLVSMGASTVRIPKENSNFEEALIEANLAAEKGAKRLDALRAVAAKPSPSATPIPKKVEPQKVETLPLAATPFEQVEKIITVVAPLKTLEAMKELQHPSKENARLAFMRAEAHIWKKAAEAAKESLLSQDLDPTSSKWMRDVILTAELFENERFEGVQGKLKELDSGWLNLKTDFKIYGPEGAPKKE